MTCQGESFSKNQGLIHQANGAQGMRRSGSCSGCRSDRVEGANNGDPRNSRVSSSQTSQHCAVYTPPATFPSRHPLLGHRRRPFLRRLPRQHLFWHLFWQPKTIAGPSYDCCPPPARPSAFCPDSLLSTRILPRSRPPGLLSICKLANRPKINKQSHRARDRTVPSPPPPSPSPSPTTCFVSPCERRNHEPLAPGRLEVSVFGSE